MPNRATKTIMPIGATFRSWSSYISCIICIIWSFTFVPFICTWIFISYVEMFCYYIYSVFLCLYDCILWFRNNDPLHQHFRYTRRCTRFWWLMLVRERGKNIYGFLSLLLK